VPPEVAGALRLLEQQGVTVLLASGKNASHLLGLARGMGLVHPVVVGENGCVVYYPASLTEILLAAPIPAIHRLEEAVRSHFGDSVSLQPNQVQLTIFPRDRSQLPRVSRYVVQRIQQHETALLVLEHVDAVDVIPQGIDKGKALRFVCQRDGIDARRVVAVGNSENDREMLLLAGQALVIGDSLPDLPGSRRFRDIRDALRCLEVIR
jgi:hydroxymethylpyrimidine pyrophosphatase-like HAD family hydrolase